MPLVFIVVFVLAGVVVHLTYRDEKLGAAITAGAVVLTVLLLILDSKLGDSITSPAPEPSSASVSGEPR